MTMRIEAGRSYTGTTTGTIKGERVFHDVDFVAARTMEPEEFVRGRESPDQDRVFVVDRTEVRDVSSPGVQTVPALFVTGSIRESEFPRREHVIESVWLSGADGAPVRVYHYAAWMRKRNGSYTAILGGQTTTMTSMLSRMVRTVERERQALR